METVLVTGGSGLVGYGLKLFAKSNWIFLSSKDCDLSNYDETNRLFAKHRPNKVIHLAACVGGLYKNMNYKVDMLEKNLLINYNVLKLSHKYKVKKVVSCLSTCIFPDKIAYPIDESSLHDGPPHTSNDAYAYAKRMLEIHSKAYQEQYNDNFVCVIPTNIYGPNDNFHLEDGHVIPALIHRCYLAKRNDEDFTVRGTGSPLRQFIHTSDLAKLIIWTLEEYDEKTPIILSVDEDYEISIGDIAKLIAKKYDYSHRLIFDSSYSDGQFKKTASNKKLRSYVPDHQFTKIEEGINNTIDWFIENYENSRK
jgi:GDP-L-fucose synthase